MTCLFLCAITSVIVAGDLKLPSVDEEDETLADQPSSEATPSGRRNNRKETASVHDSAIQAATLGKF